MKKELPKIIKSKKSNQIRESGCCFRSCGGVPGVSPIREYQIEIKKKLLKIK